ncbi:hypothetical protein BaRGS_00015971 [Batillaria attramentaria]|uniref:Nose resistant-to-fluoxetine protein N-terminal domain-containing protein n=1 Tax=Batillaria attramentaria TaxID=370345 RepID=A0ABD0L010_9CAEN
MTSVCAMTHRLVFTTLVLCSTSSFVSCKILTAPDYFDSISKLSWMSSHLQKDSSSNRRNRLEILDESLEILSPEALREQIQNIGRSLEQDRGHLHNYVREFEEVSGEPFTDSERGDSKVDEQTEDTNLETVSLARERARLGHDFEKCFDDFALFSAGLATGKSWALQMIDSFGKPSPGISDGNVLWPGAYDLCRDVRVTENMTSVSGDVNETQAFSGQYCNAVFPLPLNNSALPPGSLTYVAEGMCIPDSCTSFDLIFIINTRLILDFNSSLRVGTVLCQYEPSLDAKAIVAIVVCGVFVLLTLLGTVLDILLVQIPKWRSDETLAMFTNGVNSKGEREPLLNTHTQMYSSQIGACTKLLTSFSLYTNGNKLLSMRQGAGSLTSIHGVRFISMTWVVLGHTMLAAQQFSSNYIPWLETSRERYLFQIIANAPVAVDTFFVLSGLLVSYLSLKEMARSRGRLNWFLFYFHRFWRLTPVYMMVLFLYVSVQPHLGRGPAWLAEFNDRDNCKTTWWTNLLYLNNFVKVDKLCMGHTWYLADDMQFYVISPLIFVPFYLSPWYGSLVAGVVFLGSTITPAILTVEKHYPAGVMSAVEGETAESQRDYMADFYIKPYTRMAPYIVGMVAGYILYRRQTRRRMNKCVVLLGWLVAAGTAWWSLFGLYDSLAKAPIPVWQAALYNAVGRTAWGVSVAWVVFACCTGQGGFVNTLLSWGGLLPLSRLTYSVYLLHLPMMYTLVQSRDTPFYMSDMNLVMFYFGNLMLAYLLAVVVSLVFEAPMMGVERVLLHTKKQTTSARHDTETHRRK